MENLPLENNLGKSNSYASDMIRVCSSAASACLWESSDRDLELKKPLRKTLVESQQGLLKNLVKSKTEWAQLW